MNPEQHPQPEAGLDIPPPTPANEELVAPDLPGGNATEVIIKRHPFGLVALYLQALVGLVVALALIWFIIPSVLSGDIHQQVQYWVSVFGLAATVITIFVLFVATYVYRRNQWIVTDDSIQQVQQIGLFKRQTSELSMANIEDITAEQNGLLATAFGFGTLKVETAGERSNFHFPYCPNPNKYAQIILQARERFIESDPQTAKRANDLLNVPRT
jgi:membrane protein YdbS with pleckstrin-like domain